MHETAVILELPCGPVEGKGGRPPGRDLTELELRHLRLLLTIQSRARQGMTEFNEQLEDFVLELRESGASARGIADELGVAPSTVQGWTTQARRRRPS